MHGQKRSRHAIRGWPRQHSFQCSTSAFFRQPWVVPAACLRPTSLHHTKQHRAGVSLRCWHVCVRTCPLSTKPLCNVGLDCWRVSRITLRSSGLAAAWLPTCVHYGRPRLAVGRPMKIAAPCHLRWLDHDLFQPRNTLLATLMALSPMVLLPAG